jgi:hypothetical protein
LNVTAAPSRLFRAGEAVDEVVAGAAGPVAGADSVTAPLVDRWPAGCCSLPFDELEDEEDEEEEEDDDVEEQLEQLEQLSDLFSACGSFEGGSRLGIDGDCCERDDLSLAPWALLSLSGVPPGVRGGACCCCIASRTDSASEMAREESGKDVFIPSHSLLDDLPPSPL